MLKYSLWMVLLVWYTVPSVAQVADLAQLKYSTSETIGDFDYENELKDIATNSRIVGMGEATHGSTEYELIKTEIVKTLVIHYGYRYLLMEAATPACAALNEYVTKGIGDPKRAMLYFPWPYATKGFISMLEWLKDYNKDKVPAQQVQFWGIDIQSDNRLAVMRYDLKKWGSICGVKDTMILHQLELVKGTEKEKQQALEQLYREYAVKHYTSVTDSISTLEVIESDMCMNAGKGGRIREYREEMMFRYAKMIIDRVPEDQKILVWAHNNHVAKDVMDRKSLGKMLYQQYGDDYRVIGFDFYKGTFRASSLDENTGKYQINTYRIDGYKNSVAAMVHQLNKGVLGINTTKNTGNVLIDKKQIVNDIGAEYNNNSARDATFYTRGIKLNRVYNYLFVLDDMHPNVSVFGK